VPLEDFMAASHRSTWSIIITAALLVCGAVYVLLIVSQSGVVPGDTGQEAATDSLGSAGQLMDLAALPWSMIVLIATAVLGVALVYAQIRTSKITPEENARTEAAVRRQHAANDDM